MPRELKTNGIYNVKCVLTGEPAGTTPQVFAERAQRYGVDVKVLQDNYIGRTGAKLLSVLVNEKGVKAPDAIKKIRQSFNITATNTVEQKIVDKIVNKVTANAKKVADGEAFKARKAAALATLLGESPSDKPASEPTKPDASTKTPDTAPKNTAPKNAAKK